MPPTWSGPSANRLPGMIRETYFGFLFRMMFSSAFWLLFFCSLTVTLLFGFRGWLRNRIYWSIR